MPGSERSRSRAWGNEKCDGPVAKGPSITRERRHPLVDLQTDSFRHAQAPIGIFPMSASHRRFSQLSTPTSVRPSDEIQLLFSLRISVSLFRAASSHFQGSGTYP